jgi:hypothetical protein
MNSLPAKLAVLALVVALCALRCNCGCMADALGSVLGHAAAPAHACCHDCDEPAPTQPAPLHDSGCCADDRMPSPGAPEIPAVQAVPLLIEFARPTATAPALGRSLAAQFDPCRHRSSSLLRLHCALNV